MKPLVSDFEAESSGRLVGQPATPSGSSLIPACPLIWESWATQFMVSTTTELVNGGGRGQHLRSALKSKVWKGNVCSQAKTRLCHNQQPSSNSVPVNLAGCYNSAVLICFGSETMDLTQPSGNRQLWEVWMRGVKLPASVSSVALPSMICTYSSIQNPGIAIHAIWKNRVQSLKNIKKKYIISSSFHYGGMKETHWIRKWKCDFHAKTKKKLFWSPHCNLTLLYI